MAYTSDSSKKQLSDAGKEKASPSGEGPTLYKVNPDKSPTPNTAGHTTSSNQLTPSGK
jgi:hypothetical protein